MLPECLEEATRSWSKIFSNKNLVQGGLVLNLAHMEDTGFSHFPPFKSLLAAQVQLRAPPCLWRALPPKKVPSGGIVGEGTDYICAAFGHSDRDGGGYVNLTTPKLWNRLSVVMESLKNSGSLW